MLCIECQGSVMRLKQHLVARFWREFAIPVDRVTAVSSYCSMWLQLDSASRWMSKRSSGCLAWGCICDLGAEVKEKSVSVISTWWDYLIKEWWKCISILKHISTSRQILLNPLTNFWKIAWILMYFLCILRAWMRVQPQHRQCCIKHTKLYMWLSWMSCMTCSVAELCKLNETR